MIFFWQLLIRNQFQISKNLYKNLLFIQEFKKNDSKLICSLFCLVKQEELCKLVTFVTQHLCDIN